MISKSGVEKRCAVCSPAAEGPKRREEIVTGGGGEFVDLTGVF